MRPDSTKEGNLKTESMLDPSSDLDAISAQNEASPTVTAGGLIRAARESVGLHIAALSVALKVPVKKLEALEANQWEALPGIAFARGLASSVCRHLKVDAQPVLNLMPGNAAAQLTAITDGINAPFQKPGDRVHLADTWKRIQPTVLTVALLLLAASVMFALPDNWLAKLQPSTAGTPSQAAVPTTDQNKNLVQEVVVPLATPSQVQVIDPSVATPVQATDALPNAALSVSVGFQAFGDSWVEVLDKDKQTLVKRLFKAGETQQVTGRGPLWVSVGNAEKTKVFVSEKPFDLLPVTRENVARFSVN
jgi:cytoskeleton protein RodZ